MNVQEEIRRLAYDFYEKSGRMGGMELEHWLRAENIVMAKLASQGNVQAARLDPEKPKTAVPRSGRGASPERARSAANVKIETAGGDSEKLQKSASAAAGSAKPKPKKTQQKKPETKAAGRTKKTKS